MTPIILLALLSSPLSQPKPNLDEKIKLVQKAWLNCYLENKQSNCPYKEPDKFYDTFKFWRQALESCVDAAVKCELEKASG